MPCITFAFHEIKAVKTAFISSNANVMQNPFFNQFFAFFQQLLPCQVTILQPLQDVGKAL